MTLNAITQTNVPHPFSPADGTAANPQVNLLEGSQSQENKFTASDLQQTLYPIAGAPYFILDIYTWATMINVFISCLFIDVETSLGGISKKGNWHGWHNACISNQQCQQMRLYSTSSTDVPESTKSKLKRAVKDYGMTVIVFHVTISIGSIGICYTAVSRFACSSSLL